MSYLTWLWQDLRYGLRNLSKDWRFSALAVMTLALGIGATTIIFSAIDGILLEPFPFKNVDRDLAFYVHDVNRPKENGRFTLTVPEFTNYREQNHVFEDVVGQIPIDLFYTDKSGTQLFQGDFITANSFAFWGTPPLLGRWITNDDGNPGAPPVFAMSYRLWTKQFNQDPSVLGKVMTLNGVQRTLVGIMPPRFLLLNRDVWIPLPWTHSDISNSETGNVPLRLFAYGRMKPGINLRSAASDLDVLGHRLSAIYPKDYPKHFKVLTMTLTDRASGPFKPMLYALMAAVSMLLLIACSNVANLLLARATVREKEIAIRSALGASRGRVVLQLLTETFLIALAGCFLGCVFAYAGLHELVAKIPSYAMAAEVDIAMRPAALLFAVGVAMLTTVLCGLAPAVHAAGGLLATKLAGTGKGGGGSFRHGKLRAALVIFEVALSILLLTGAGLMMRSLFALQHVDLGFNPENILFVRVALPPGRYDTAQQKILLFQQLLPRVTAVPGVRAATVAMSLPPSGATPSDVTIPGKTHTENWRASFDLCSEGYFQTLGLRLLRGRLLSADDIASARHVVVINDLLARSFFKDEDPIGKQIKFDLLDRLNPTSPNLYFEIIGVVGDSKNQGLQDQPLPEGYFPHTVIGTIGSRALLIRTAVDPNSLLETIRKEVWSVDSNIALTSTGTVVSYLQQFSYAAPKFGLITLGAFAGIGLLLVIIGIFSVMEYTVSLQTHDIGVRMALGAQRESILRMILKKGLALIAAGVMIGVLGSIGLTRFLASQIWGVSATDPWTFGAVIALILIVGVAACALPARYATSVDPLIALRHE